MPQGAFSPRSLLLNPLEKSPVVYISGYRFTPWRKSNSALAREEN
jgi:hypothetical protein